MSILKEFKEFAVKGNVIDLAIGVIIGSAFGKIVSSLVSDVILPPIGVLVGGVNFKDIKIVIKQAILDNAGAVTAPEVTINIGNFLQTLFDFTMIAFVIFLSIKGLNNMKKEEPVAPAAAPEPSNEEKLLTEIRDLLKK
ncbi:MAG: large-conductance mechanosensitive channel protein MscL [Cytophagales bacterium]